MRFKTSMLRTNLCDCGSAYYALYNMQIGYIVKRRSFRDTNNANKRNRKVTYKNNTPFRSCISKISNTFIDNVEDLNIVMPIYNLVEYSNTYSMTAGSLWDYYGDEVNDSVIENNDDCNKMNNKIITSKYFEFKTKKNGKHAKQ